MAAASRMTYVGAAIFAGAAVVSALAAMPLHGVPHPDRSLTQAIWIRSIWSLAAGISAALSFLLVRRFDWRSPREPFLGRALVVGFSTVAFAHLLIGVVYSSMLLFVRASLPETPFGADGDFFRDAIGMSVFAAVYGWYVTLPLGIAGAAFLEWLERRQPTASPSPSSV